MTPPPIADRRRWMAVLACAPRTSLAGHAGRVLSGHVFETLRAPEVGLAMVRARMDGTGERFNLGEATLTRCVVRHLGAGDSTVGVGYLLGRDAERVTWMAQLDALLQQPALQASLHRSVVEPLDVELKRLRAQERERTASSRVEFFTLQPEVAR